jgi:tetratricopeptide (TPR) repeat protein
MSERATRRLVLVAAVLVLVVSGCGRRTDRREMERVKVALAKAERLQKAARWGEARAWLACAEAHLQRGGPAALRRRVEQMRKDVEMLARLEEVRLRVAEPRGTDAAYAEAFRAYGIDVGKLEPREAARRVRASAIRAEVVAGLDGWALVKPGGAARKALWAVADAADASPWRQALRQALATRDIKKLQALAAEPEADRQPPAVLVLLAEGLSRAGLAGEAEKVLRRGQQRHPGDFWLNYHLALLLALRGPRSDEAVGYYRAALALRPSSPAVYTNLGVALSRQGRLEEAIACFRSAIRLDPRVAQAHANLGVALVQQRKVDEAIAAFRHALKIDPRNARAHTNLGMALVQQKKLAEAVACFRQAIRLDPRDARAHAQLGVALAQQGKRAEASAAFQRAIALDPTFAPAHTNLGVALMELGRLDEAIACFRHAIRLAPRDARAHLELGNGLRRKGDAEGASAAYRRALELQPELEAAQKGLEALRKEKAPSKPGKGLR